MTHTSGRPGKLAAVPPQPVTAAELRDAYTRLLEVELAALETLSRVLRECPQLPGASNWALTAALDPERMKITS